MAQLVGDSRQADDKLSTLALLGAVVEAASTFSQSTAFTAETLAVDSPWTTLVGWALLTRGHVEGGDWAPILRGELASLFAASGDLVAIDHRARQPPPGDLEWTGPESPDCPTPVQVGLRITAREVTEGELAAFQRPRKRSPAEVG
ncbi:MAG: hypothetical protein AAF368_14705, partial [Planctomycetota bacterium]